MEHPYTNKLIEESSPYLLQHAHNPVDWYPWGEEALEKAKKEKKLILISIGYSSCHWCHVMEHESFEDTTVAAFMNEHFINIKVDREERPDIDDVYMTACQLSSGGNCGWPLNSFALPDGRPVWAGTYFPKLKWLDVLEYFRKTWAEEGDKLEDYGSLAPIDVAAIPENTTPETKIKKLKKLEKNTKTWEAAKKRLEEQTATLAQIEANFEVDEKDMLELRKIVSKNAESVKIENTEAGKMVFDEPKKDEPKREEVGNEI